MLQKIIKEKVSPYTDETKELISNNSNKKGGVRAVMHTYIHYISFMNKRVTHLAWSTQVQNPSPT